MDPQLAPPSVGWTPSTPKNVAVPAPGLDIDINSLLSHLSEKYPGYLEHFFRPVQEPVVEVIDLLEDRPAIKKPSVKSSRSKAPPGPSAQPPSAPKGAQKPRSGPSAQIPESPQSPEPEDAAAAADEDIEMSSSADNRSDGFETVTSRYQKRKLKASKTPADPPVKIIATEVPSSSSRTKNKKHGRPSQSEPPTAESRDSAMEEPAKERVPPLYVREKSRWDKLVPMLDSQGIAFSEARSTAIGIRVQCPDSANHRRLTATLRSENIGFHTYALQDERVLRVVIKGLPREISTELIKEDLVSQGIPVIEVHRMYQRWSKQPFDMVLVIAELTAEAQRIRNLKSVCRLSGLKFEDPKGRGMKMQCHRCQSYGHGARYCYAQPRCVKCLGEHLTADCTRKQPTDEPPSCVLCGTQGHPANYRGCPKAPKRAKPKGKSVVSQKPSDPPAERFVPAPPPATNAWSRPLNRPTPATVPTAKAAPKSNTPVNAPAAPTEPKTNSNDKELSENDWNYIQQVVDTVDFDELHEFLDKAKVNPLKAAREHAKLLKQIKNLRYNVNG